MPIPKNRAGLEPAPTKINEYAAIVQKTWLDLPNHISNIKLDEFIVMPNHIHGIIQIMSTRMELRLDPGKRAGLEPALQENKSIKRPWNYRKSFDN